MTKQITVTDSPVPAAFAALVRQTLLVIGGYLIGQGYLTADAAEAITTAALVLLPLVYGQLKGWKRHNDLVTVADQVHDSVAVVTS